MINDVVIDEREAKLPQWAQTLIGDLRRRLTDATNRAEEARLATDPNTTDTVLYGRRGADSIGLPPRSEVFFVFGPDREEDIISAVLTGTPPRLALHSPRGLIIAPVVSNGITVRLDRPHWTPLPDGATS